MSNENAIVLPDTLVAQLIENAATLSGFLHKDFDAMSQSREAFRASLLRDNAIVRVRTDYAPCQRTFAIDGAHLAEIDRASAYSASCAVRVGQAGDVNDQSSCLATLPHVASLNALSTGFMIMQEIMMAVKALEDAPDAVCLIDGSRISAIIVLNSFYAGLKRDMPGQLASWRQQAIDEPEREPGRTLARFESRDWLTPYLSHPTIVGNLKLVTTTTLVEQYAPEWLGRFDDKTLAALVLYDGEAIATRLSKPNEPFHIERSYPYFGVLEKHGAVGDQLSVANSPLQIYHVYYKPDSAHGVFKIEFNQALSENLDQLGALFAWWRNEIRAPDMMEPYSYYIADRFAKEAVSVAKNALKEITRRDAQSASWAWYFTQPYRTE